MIRQLKYTLFICLLPFLSNAQSVNTIEDDMGIKGKIRYSGVYSDTTLPKQGPIEIRWREIVNNTLTTYRIQGQTKNYQPVGKWIWEEAKWSHTINVGNSIQPEFKAKGERMKWEANFHEGIPDGKWSLTIDSIHSNGNSFGRLVRIDMNYFKGKPSGFISMEDNIGSNKLRLKGQCDTNGIATGTWSFTYSIQNGSQIKEERVYQKGLLTERRIGDGITKTITKIEHTMNFLEKENRKEGITGTRIGDQLFQQDELGGIVTELFHENMHAYFLKGWLLSTFPFEVVRYVPAFKRLEYPLTEEELNDFNQCRQLVQKQKQEIETVLAGNISIHRARNAELDTTISFLQLNYNRLNCIDSLLTRVEHPFFTYKNRYKQGISHWIADVNQFQSAKGEVFDSLSVKILPVIVTSDSLHIFKELIAILEQNEVTFPNYYQTIENAHISVKQEGELKELEDKIILRLANQQSFYSDKTGVYSLINNKWIKTEIPVLLQKYAQTDEYENALIIGHKILTRLDSLEKWHQQVELINNAPDLLKARYTYLAYNPYTGATDISMTVKKRFLNATLTYLWPYLLNEIEQENDWNQWAILWNRHIAIFNYLLEFSGREDAASKRVDKRVRQEKKPEKMLRIIEHHMGITNTVQEKKND